MAQWYDKYLKSMHWQRTRLRRLLKANLDNTFNVIQCDDPACGMWFPLELIEVHHKTYERLGREEMDDLAVLCCGCHPAQHDKPRPQWWHEMKSRNARMVSGYSIRHLGGVKHVGEVVIECLKHFSGPVPEFVESIE
jgi:hypothetical protein